MWWKLALAYLVALPAVLYVIYRAGTALGGSQRHLQRRDLSGRLH